MPLDGNPQDFNTRPAEVKTVDDEVCKTLRRAADVIRKNGLWCGGYGEGGVASGTTPSRCAGLAIADSTEYISVNAVLDEFARHIGVHGCPGIYAWNDARGRTSAEVISALEGAADSRARALAARGGS